MNFSAVTPELFQQITTIIATSLPDTKGIQEAWWLLEYITGQPSDKLRIAKDFLLTQHQQDILSSALRCIKIDKKPLQYVLGTIPFAHLCLSVRPPILIPRPETEEWVTSLTKHLQTKLADIQKKALRILEIGTGSGCIALTFAQAFPHAHIIATDISRDALALAQENMQKNNVRNVALVASDLFNAFGDEEKKYHHYFDLIVSNPPYIDPADWYALPPHIRNWEDRKALIATDHGFAILKNIIKHAPTFLRHNDALLDNHLPQLVLEIGSTQAQEITTYMQMNHYCDIQTQKDLAGSDRVVWARITHEGTIKTIF